MTTARCVDWLADRELHDYIRAEARRHSRYEELRDGFFADAWVAISESAEDYCDLETLKRIAHNAIFRAYRRELRQRKLIHELLESYEAEDVDPEAMVPCGRRRDAGIVLQPRQVWES